MRQLHCFRHKSLPGDPVTRQGARVLQGDSVEGTILRPGITVERPNWQENRMRIYKVLQKILIDFDWGVVFNAG